jgi:CheY-like chemotaxis protein
MKILFVDNDLTKRDFYKNLLSEICDIRDLFFYSTAEDVIDFIKNTLIPEQIHIDVIISEFDFPDRSFKDILELIRDSDVTYSFNNFKLSSIPIVLHTAHFPINDYENLDVDLIVRKPLNENSNYFVQKIKSLIKSWRRSIFDDLEVLGLGVNYDFTNLNIGYTVRVKAEETKILSWAFVLKQERLPYLWLNKDFFEHENTIDELQQLIKQYMDLPRNTLERRQWEGQLQDFFNRNPNFLFRDNYSQFWSEPRLYYPNAKKHIKPDFVARPIISPELGKNWNIVDLKLPAQEFLQQTDFHKSFVSSFQKCLTQITDYKEYFNNDNHKDNIKKVLEFHPKHPKLTLVVGRRNKLLEQQDKIYQRLDQMNYADINLITYDEVIDYQKKELERLFNNRLY